MQGTFDSLNPFNLKAGSAAQGLIGPVYQTLMTRSLDEPFTLYGLIVQRIETNDDRSRVVFHLDPRAKFSDGSPLTSKDIRFSFELLARRAGRSIAPHSSSSKAWKRRTSGRSPSISPARTTASCR